MKYARPDQELKQHLLGVAENTARRMPKQWRNVGYYAGLWHDLGKILPEWQNYLNKKRSRLPHSPHGAMLARSYASHLLNVPTLTFVIAGHHGGLRNKEYLAGDAYQELAQNWEQARDEAAQGIANFLPEQLPEFDLKGSKDKTRLEFATRMLFGCLVDADRLDAAIFAGNASPDEDKASFLDKLSICFNPRPAKGALAELRQKLRQEFASDCMVKARCKTGLYRLTGATGIGKTQASLKFSLAHCQANNNLTGILYVAPLKSIIEQNWQEYQKWLKIPILAHYSDFQPPEDETKDYKLTTERWDAEVVCTSGVQFFESLFSRSAAKCRKLSHLMNRCILIDEAQTIPLEYAKPILDVLKSLVKDWGCTVVLMSATQPSFQNVDPDFDAKCINIINKSKLKYYFEQIRLVNYQVSSETWNWETLAQKISKCDRSLTIVNTTKLATEGFRALANLVDGEWFHLSARMIPVHRQQVLKAIGERLKDELPHHVISTQVIEAGVDLDFPFVFRQFAPLDSIVQAAGRCNREGKIEDWQKAIVQVFELETDSYPSHDYKKRTQITRDLINSNVYNLNKNLLEAIAAYYQRCYSSLTGDKNNIQKLRKNLQFEDVDKAFKLIEDSQQFSVFVPWQKEGTKIKEFLNFSQPLREEDWRKLQPYTISLPNKLLPLAEQTKSGAILLSPSLYDDNFGVIDIDNLQISPASLIF